MLNPDTVIGDRYIVKRKLAEGGMAEIYLCTAKGPEGFEKEVVIKRIRSFWGDDDMFIQMFIAEARLASRLNHANIVQIFHFDKHEDTYYLAMEFVNGPSLRDFLRKTKEKNKPLPILMASEIAANIARGLHYAHNLSIVHRDVSPHNILLSFDGNIKLADFGIAKTGSQHTSPGVLKGKFAYMAPEQARGEAVDARTDIFALGIVLWEALTRSRLFEYDSYINALQALQENLIVQPSRFNSEVPEELDRVVLKALNRNPAERYQTAQEFERALINFILTHARSADDTNISHFLQAVYGDAPAAPAEKKDSLTRTYTPPVPAASSAQPALSSFPSSQKLSPIYTREESAYVPPSESAKPQPSTLIQPKSRTPAPSSASGISPAVITDEFAPASESAASTKQHKSLANFLRHPVAIVFALIISAGIGVYVTLQVRPHDNTGQNSSVVPPEPPKPEPPKPEPPKPEPPPEPPKPEPPPEPPKPEPPPPEPPKPESHVVIPPPEQAKITIDARPWAMVSINNRKPVEVIGRREFRLPPGTHRIKFSHPSKEEVKTVQIKQAADAQTVNFNATPK